MTNDKKDLTRIEDLGEFFHQADEADDYFSLPDLPPEPESVEELPELPTEASEEAVFESSPEEESFSKFTFHTEDPLPAELPDDPEPLQDPTPLEEPHLPVVEMTEQTPRHELPVSPREDFQEARVFAEKASIGAGEADCNPAFSVIIQDLLFLEDSDDILLLLREVGFSEELMSTFKRQLERGSLLIPRVSEFTAIYLTHHLRRFRLTIKMGLSDLLHPPKTSREEEARGLVSRKTLGQNHQHQFHFKSDAAKARDIILTTLSQLDGRAIERYLGVASEHTFLTAEEVETETAEAIHQSYEELAQKLKGHALQHKANAVVGINYQLTPMPAESATPGHYRYKLTCTGNLVWAQPQVE